MTPLLQSVDFGSYPIFRFVFEVYLHVQRSAGKKYPILSETFVIQELEKKETALMRAVRMNRLEMVFSMIHTIGPNEVLNKPDFYN